ncbi:MAG TPA: response regulator [Thermoanaerobaculia bacterium]
MSATRRATIAIVDDDASVRVSLRRLCEVFGLSATAYASGRELLESLDGEASRTDCLLLDAHMPEMNGLELQRHLVMRGVHIPTIICTAGDAPAASAHAAATDVVEYLRKPVSAADLLAAIERALRGREPSP